MPSAALGAAALSPRPVFDEPWLFSLIIAPMLAVAVLAERRQSASEAWLRWDLAPLAVGHVVAAIALIRAVAIDETTSAALSLGLLAMLYGPVHPPPSLDRNGLCPGCACGSDRGHRLARARTGSDEPVGDGRCRPDRGVGQARLPRDGSRARRRSVADAPPLARRRPR